MEDKKPRPDPARKFKFKVDSKDFEQTGQFITGAQINPIQQTIHSPGGHIPSLRRAGQKGQTCSDVPGRLKIVQTEGRGATQPPATAHASTSLLRMA
jgi:hypothetical protein